MPQAMSADEIEGFLGRVRQGGSEFFCFGVMELDQLAKIRQRDSRSGFRLAKANTMLLRFPAQEMSHGLEVSIEAISPNDADVQVFIAALAAEPPTSPGKRVMPFAKNDVSVALWVSIGPHRVLLGADLENSIDPNRGWQAVLSSPAPLV